MMFSTNAVIAPRDRKLCLMFWGGDIRKSQIIFIDASVRLQLFCTWVTKTGKSISFNQEDLEVCLDWRKPDSEFRNELFLMLPMLIIVIHVIDEQSPF